MPAEWETALRAMLAAEFPDIYALIPPAAGASLLDVTRNRRTTWVEVCAQSNRERKREIRAIEGRVPTPEGRLSTFNCRRTCDLYLRVDIAAREAAPPVPAPRHRQFSHLPRRRRPLNRIRRGRCAAPTTPRRAAWRSSATPPTT